jgi:hypothetical protein
MDDSSPMASKLDVDGGELSQLHDGGRRPGAPARATRRGRCATTFLGARLLTVETRNNLRSASVQTYTFFTMG